MNKKHTFKKVTAFLMGIALSIGATGCGFITTDNQEDLKQVVAEVDITAGGKVDSSVAGDVSAIIKNLATDVTKRDLISYYLSTGYQYVESYGYTYKDTFNMLLDGLISREIMIQYAIAYYLQKGKESGINATNCALYIEDQIGKASGKEKELLSKHKEVLTLKYFLTDGGKGSTEEYDKAVYSLKKSLNDSLDSMEASYITAESEEHEHEEARTLPTGVDTEKEDYYTTNYEIYTGRNAAGACGEYKTVDGSTVASRQKAYNAFLTNLHSYSLINTDEGEVENTATITELNYYYVELASVLGQSLINKYFESLEDAVSSKLNADYMKKQYEDYLAQNQRDYEGKPTDFSTAMDSASADSFMLYGLKDFGYVYNILIPFSASQTEEYASAKNRSPSEEWLYAKRREILANVTGKDLRDSWISMDDHVNYSYEKDGKFYFFEDNFGGTKYEELTHYAGTYAFNGTVTKENGEYEISATELSIDGIIAELEQHITNTAGVTASGAKVTAYSDDTELAFKDETTDKVNYGKFTYYTGSVALTDKNPANVFDKTSEQYKALSAVNEILFAYGTDPGAFNTYLGYSVTPYTTSFVKEFEYAAQEVVASGVGSYAVCATDYGWHILYCSFKYEGGEVYAYDHNKIEQEGTFSNLFYEYIRESAYTNHATEEQSKVLLQFNNDACVTRYQKRYQDLLDMDN